VLAYYLPVLVCMALATVWSGWIPSSQYSRVGCVLVVGVASAAFAGLSWGVIRLCQRLNLFAR